MTMEKRAGALVTSLISGILFGLGLVISGMVKPSKVIGFLDVTGQWDPSLAFVMGGALLVHFPLRRAVMKRRQKPVYDRVYHMPPKNRGVDKRLIAGSVLFGAGWGIAGFCPGPVLVSIGAWYTPALIVFGAMLAGMVLYSIFDHATRPTFDHCAFDE